MPSRRTTRATADFRRPVPNSVCAAKPPGRLDLTKLLRSAVSTPAAAEADTTSGEVEQAWEIRRDFERGKDRAFGLCDTWEEKEREDRENAREDIEVAIFVLYPE